MTIRIAIITACASTLLLAPFGVAWAQDRGGFIIPLIADKKDPAAGKQNRSAINTSRSNIKHGIADKGGIGGSKQPGTLVNTSRSNIKHDCVGAGCR